MLINNNGDNSKKVKNNKLQLFKIVVVPIILFCFISYSLGYRLTPYKSSQAVEEITDKSILLADIKMDSYHVYFYENEDVYRTIICQYNFPFWKSSINFYANKTEDKVKLVGWCSAGDNRGAITMIPVQNFDENVAYIEMGFNVGRYAQETPVGDVIVFTWDKSIPWNDLDGIAYNKSGEPLYYMGYEIKNNTIHPDELRWLEYE